MQRAGLPELETVYFDPIIRYDSLGKGWLPELTRTERDDEQRYQ
jgi:hypothetical protein